jgi:hypothetical protein
VGQIVNTALYAISATLSRPFIEKWFDDSELDALCSLLDHSEVFIGTAGSQFLAQSCDLLISKRTEFFDVTEEAH